MTTTSGTVSGLLSTARQHPHCWRFVDAWRLLIEAHHVVEHGVLVDQDDAVDVVRTLAVVCHELGDLDPAFALLDPLVTELTATRGLRDAATVQALAVLGTIRHDRGRFTDVESCYGLVADSGVDLSGPAGRAALVNAAHHAMLLVDTCMPFRGVDRLRDAHAALRRAARTGLETSIGCGLPGSSACCCGSSAPRTRTDGSPSRRDVS